MHEGNNAAQPAQLKIPGSPFPSAVIGIMTSINPAPTKKAMTLNARAELHTPPHMATNARCCASEVLRSQKGSRPPPLAQSKEKRLTP